MRCLEADVVNEEKLSKVLSEFARTLITDFPIQRILDRLVDRIVDVLPITSAGVTLISKGTSPHYIAASNASARRFERLQTEMEQGPCIEAFETGSSVSLPDLSVDERFPQFSPAAVEAGLAAVFTFPMYHGLERFGALDLYRDTPGDLDPGDMIAAQTLADVAAALLLNATARAEALATSERFHYNAMHDPLTGLPNRLLLQERMDHAGFRSQRAHTFSAVLFLDLDGFKQVNDDHGHLIGDQLLRSVAHRLSGLVRSGDTLARFSGDEFVFFCEELHSEDDVAILVGRIDQTFSVPFELEGVEVTVRASVGSAYVGPGESITSDLINRADHDMYRAKREGVSLEIIHISNGPFSDDDQGLEVAMRRALMADEFDVAYQPIVRTADGAVTGVEALLRWTHPDRGPLPALLMVSIAERSELICEIGTWILEQACQDHARWLASGPGNSLDLAVNVSVRQLMNPAFCDTVSAVLDRTGMDASSLVLELTESIVMARSAHVAEVLVGVNELGVRLALDDFGTGFSSLSYLNRLPIQIVKIDRAFISELDQPTGRIVVAAVTSLAHQLGLTVVAEGIETEAQRNETQAAGCDYAQGYFFGRPMPADSIQKLLVA